MSNYSNSPNKCRVDLWKKSEKWYTTESIVFSNKDYDKDIHTAFRNALKISLGDHYIGMRATCLEPYHKNSHPLSVIWEG